MTFPTAHTFGSGKKIRVAVVGCGLIARRSHISAWKKLGAAITLVDTSQAALDSTGREFGIGSMFHSLSDLFERTNVDIVDIATPPDSHCDLAIAALERGCHVIVEKPMCLTVEEADRVLSVARSRDLRVGVCHDCLYLPAIQYASEYLESGRAGRLNGLIFRYLEWNDNPRLDDGRFWYRKLRGDIFYHIIPHVAYLSMKFLGDLTVVSVDVSKISGTTLPFDQLNILMKNKKRQYANIVMSINSPGGWMEIEFIGEKRNVRAGLAFYTFRGGTREGGLRPTLDTISENLSMFFTITLSLFKGMVRRRSGRSTHFLLFNDFVASIGRKDSGKFPFLCSGEGGRRVVALTNEIVERLQT
ncbi:MAG: Gfo/Idh/MocA family oxidoreductase [Nitrososphaerota archaeon]|nr:Gfo/Idh/MocA family oxidoreductase [Nitrososphaerota archaeon]MDG6919933.1 Gfo/Idh/MocA family oxidoreductase [Nitrososphaerota archaeon]